MADWETVKLPRHMVNRINEFVETRSAKESGFTSKSQAIVFAVREFLRNYSKYLAYLDYLGIEKNVITIMDHELGKIVKVIINKENETLSCQTDNSDSCNHIRFVWTLPRFENELKNFVKPAFQPKIKEYTVDEIHEEIKKVRKLPLESGKKKLSKKEFIKILKNVMDELEN